jgi:DNA polymerase zeta
VELVRRDGCDAVVKIMTKCLAEIFETKNLSNVKRYLEKQWSKILNGHINYKDFIIAKEVKLAKYTGSLPAHAIVALNMESKDPMARAKYGERIKYLVVTG